MKKIYLVPLIVVALFTFLSAGYASVAHADDDDDLKFRAELSGAEEVPEPVDTETTGKAKFEVNDDMTEIEFELEIDDATAVLDGPAAHIHCAPAGENGPVVVHLAGVVSGGFDGDVRIEATLTEANIVDPSCGATITELVQSMQEGNTYVNVHSEAHPGGEIRGQIQAKGDDEDDDDVMISSAAIDGNGGDLEFELKLSGSEEVSPTVETETTGKAKFEVNDDMTEIEFELEIDDATAILGAAGAHIHCAPAGENGPVVAFLAGVVPGGFNGDVEIEGTLTDANIVDTSCGATIAELVQSMLDGKTYVNVHSAANPDGEIRGQIQVKLDELEFKLKLSGSEEVSPTVETETTGKAEFKVNKARTEIEFELEIDDATAILGAAGAHIHCAPAGENGPVVVFLAGEVPGGLNGDVEIEGTLTEANIVDPSCGTTIAELVQSMLDGNTYVNVHSVAHPTGEIRGQIAAKDGDKDDDNNDVDGDAAVSGLQGQDQQPLLHLPLLIRAE